VRRVFLTEALRHGVKLLRDYERAGVRGAVRGGAEEVGAVWDSVGSGWRTGWLKRRLCLLSRRLAGEVEGSRLSECGHSSGDAGR
jgi:hypothetical protein